MSHLQPAGGGAKLEVFRSSPSVPPTFHNDDQETLLRVRDCKQGGVQGGASRITHCDNDHLQSHDASIDPQVHPIINSSTQFAVASTSSLGAVHVPAVGPSEDHPSGPSRSRTRVPPPAGTPWILGGTRRVELRRGGAGLNMKLLKQGRYIRAVNVRQDGVSSRAGIVAGDVLLRVNGLSLIGASLEATVQFFTSTSVLTVDLASCSVTIVSEIPAVATKSRASRKIFPPGPPTL